MILLALLGCANDAWEVAASEISGGVMLAAATLGDEVVISGGSYDRTGSLWRYDGQELCLEEGVTEGAALWWIHGRSADDWYAVGEHGVVIHQVAGERTREDLPVDITLFGVYDDGDSAWIVGGDVRGDQTGQIWRKEGGGDWEQVSATPGLGFKVHDGWVVGAGFAWEWNGSEFVDRTPTEAPRLLTVRVRGPNDVFAVGGLTQAEFWQWDGSTWSEPDLLPACVGQPLNGVYTEPGDDVWVAGDFGTAAAWSGEWSCADFPITADHFHAVWRHDDELLAVGGNLRSSDEHYGTLARYGTSGAVPFTGSCQ